MATVSVNVTQNAPSNFKATDFSTPINFTSTRLAVEPTIRVGMYQPGAFVQFRSDEDDYTVFAGTENMGVLPKSHLGVFRFENNVYSFESNTVSFESEEYIRLAPVNNARAIFSLPNYSRYVKWKGQNNFNTYRGAVEYRQGQVDKKLYAVNELLMEDYVAGIAETSNLAPTEYIKALLVAARTYAYKSFGKYPFFDVLGNTYDQLYLGYESERLMPLVANAARATRGQMVTYDGEVVTTPYFANSTGTTKSWNKVWGNSKGNHSWLVPVVAEYDRGQPMRGHGVGMSARDAAVRADKEGVDWQHLIKHYYTGVELEKLYN